MTWTLVNDGTATFADGNTGHVYTLPSGAPSASDLDILCVNSDTTVSTPSGFTLGPTFVSNQGAYLWYRIATGSEGSTVTITTSGNFPTQVSWSRWQGENAADVNAVAHVDVGNTSSTPAVSTGTLGATGELVIAFAALHGMQSNTLSSPSWSSGYTALTADQSGTTSADAAAFAAYKTTAGTASESPSVSWSGGATTDQYILVQTFTAASGAGSGVTVPRATLAGSGGGYGFPLKPWQFHVDSYGARGDGKMITDAAMTSGSATLTSASAPFSSADVGKAVMVNNAGPGGSSNPSGALITTISAYTSATTVTLAASAGATVSSMTAVYGTDDTSAAQAAMAALSAYQGFTGSPHYAELLFDPAVYILATYPTPGGSGTYGFAQIPLPVIDTTGTKTKPTVVIRGAFEGSVLDFWEQDVPQLSGTTLLSMIDVHSYDATYGPPSVIGGPTVTAPFANNFNNVLVVIDGIQVMCPVNPGQIAYDFFYMCQFAVRTASADVFASVTGSPTINFTGSGPTNTRGQGFRTNYTGLNDRCDIDSLSIEGYYYGMSLDEHIAARRLAIIYTNTAIYINPTGGAQATHGAWIGYASLEICQYCVYVPTGGGGSLFGLVIDNLDNEGSVTAHIYDPSNYLTGSCRILPSQSASLPQTPIVTGAANWEILSMSQARSVQSAPSYTLGTAFQNPWWRHAWVTLDSGTTTGILIGPTSAACTTSVGTTTTSPVTFRLPSGWWLNIQGSVKPSVFDAVPD